MLEHRQDKNDLVWSTTKLVLKLPRFSPTAVHRIGEWKSEAISKLILLPIKRGRSYIVFAIKKEHSNPKLSLYCTFFEM